MKLRRAVVIGLMGAFAVGAQTALFREYLVVYGGNELGSGFFFSSWLFWVGIGAVVARRTARGPDLAGRLALYPPALLLQLLLIRSLRSLAGVEPTDLFPTGTLFLLTFLTNSPVSFVTGFLFPAAAAADGSVRRVYVLECLGSFFGGAGVTLALATGLGALPALVLLSAATAAAGLSLALPRRGTALAHSLLLGVSLLLLVPPVGAGARGVLDRLEWQSLHPETVHEAGFESPYRRLDVGRVSGQTVAAANGVLIAAWPGGDAVVEDAALLLAEAPAGRRILVAGLPALPLAEALRDLGGEQVTLVVADRAGYEFLRDRTPASDRGLDVRFGDLRRAAFRATLPAGAFGLVVVEAGDPDTVLAARQYTREFYEEAKGLLGANGVLATSVTSAENYFGTELRRYGASVFATLQAVFPEVVIAPGERAWFFAGRDPGRVSVDPAVLEARLDAMPRVGPAYPAERIHTRLPKRRVDFVRQVYAPRPGEDLVSKDDRPLVYLLNLLVLGRVEGAGLSRLATGVGAAGFGALLLPFLVLLLFRVRHVRAFGGGDGGRFGGVYLLLLAGGTAIALDLVLLLAYQQRFGLLMTNVGLANALFLLGLFGGGLLGSRLPQGRATPAAAAVGLAVFTAALPPLARAVPSEAGFFSLFLLSGVVSGVPFPLAAGIYARSGVGPGRAGAVLEGADHFGGAAGAILAGVLLVPVFGVPGTVQFLGVALLSVPLLILAEKVIRPRARPPYLTFPYPRAAATLAAVVVAVAAVSYPVRREIDRPRVRLDPAHLRSFLGADRIHEVEEPFVHYDAWTSEGTEPENRTLATMAVVTDVTGYAGPLNLLLSIDRDLTIRRVELLESKETPAYIEELPAFLARFEGRSAADRFELAGELAKITGATVSSRAALETVNRARDRVFTDLLGRSPPPGAPASPGIPFGPREGLTLAFFLLAGPVFLRGGARLRTVLLAAVVAVLGIYLNQQLSARHLLDLLALSLPPPGNLAHLLLVGGAVLLGVLFGPVYCGFLCPFGAAQELLAKLGFARRPSAALDRRARFVKHGVLAAAAVGFLLFGADAALGFDPLAVAFSGKAGGLMWALIGLVAVLSIFLCRFWCRYLCPAGAFLSLFNRLGLLLPFARQKHHARCDLGVGSRRDLDCLQCNRCLTGEAKP